VVTLFYLRRHCINTFYRSLAVMFLCGLIFCECRRVWLPYNVISVQFSILWLVSARASKYDITLFSLKGCLSLGHGFCWLLYSHHRWTTWWIATVHAFCCVFHWCAMSGSWWAPPSKKTKHLWLHVWDIRLLKHWKKKTGRCPCRTKKTRRHYKASTKNKEQRIYRGI